MAGDGSTAVMYGGVGPGPLDDGWRFDGVSWTQFCGSPLAACGPPPLLGATMLWTGSQFALFGGTSDFSTPNEDTWVLSGNAWTKVCGSGMAPCGPAGHTLASAATLTGGGALMAGGLLLNGGPVLGAADVWRWDGSAWSQEAVPWDTEPFDFNAASFHACGPVFPVLATEGSGARIAGMFTQGTGGPGATITSFLLGSSVPAPLDRAGVCPAEAPTTTTTTTTTTTDRHHELDASSDHRHRSERGRDGPQHAAGDGGAGSRRTSSGSGSPCSSRGSVWSRRCATAPPKSSRRPTSSKPADPRRRPVRETGGPRPGRGTSVASPHGRCILVRSSPFGWPVRSGWRSRRRSCSPRCSCRSRPVATPTPTRRSRPTGAGRTSRRTSSTGEPLSGGGWRVTIEATLDSNTICHTLLFQCVVEPELNPANLTLESVQCLSPGWNQIQITLPVVGTVVDVCARFDHHRAGLDQKFRFVYTTPVSVGS